MKLFKKAASWKFLSNFWALVALVFLSIDFIYQHAYSVAAGACGIIYVAVLGIYVGNKEYERWKEHHKSLFRGETFVIIWSVIIFIMLITSFVTAGIYSISGSMIEVYIAILALFAITQRSKSLHKKHITKK